jgi:hypothetical protein
MLVYTPEGLTRFLTTPMAVFSYQTPGQMLERGEAAQVLTALTSDYEGLGA